MRRVHKTNYVPAVPLKLRSHRERPFRLQQALCTDAATTGGVYLPARGVRTSSSEGMGHWGSLTPGFHQCPALCGQRAPSVFVIAFLIHLQIILYDDGRFVKRKFLRGRGLFAADRVSSRGPCRRHPAPPPGTRRGPWRLPPSPHIPACS